MKRIFLLIGGFAAIAILASCGGSDSSGDSEPEGEKIVWQRGAPVRIENRGPVPKDLIVKNLRAGSGAVLRDGTTGTFRFKSFNYATGQRYENWWPQPFTTGFGKGESLDAWETGLKGMKVGERRQLIVPPDQAYGNVPVVYVIELIKVS